LVHNNSWANRYIGLASSNVIGADGIVLQMKLPSRELNNATEGSWTKWGREATADGRLSIIDVQHIADQNQRVDGECFIRLLPGFENNHRFAVQFIDPDQLDPYHNRPREGTENEIRMGVEVDTLSRPVAYHFTASRPGDIHWGSREKQVIPASEVIHYYRQYRPNQTRGLPRFAPIMADLNMLRGYMEAELVAARMGAAKVGFFESDFDSGATWAGDGSTPLKMDAEPGSLEQLPAGLRFNSWDPSHPNAAFPDFMRASLQSIASGLGVSYTSLTSDLKEANFASSRVGLLGERDMWRVDQRFAIDHLLRPLFDAWAPMAWIGGQLETAIQPQTYIDSATWQPRGWTWVDPLKDVQAAVMAKNNRLTSTQKIVGSQGHDMEDIYEDHRREAEIAEQSGVSLVGGSGPAVTQDNSATDDELDEMARLAIVGE